MCVIVVQNKGQFPGWKTLENCWNRNPHGAGFMYQTEDGIIIEKGLMTFEELKHLVKGLPDYRTRNIVYHFRIASHGSVVPQNTHPYPLSPRVDHMRVLSIKAPAGIAHNGIISKKSYDEKEQERLNLTDTAQFIRETFSELRTNGKIKKRSINEELRKESNTSGSRFAIMDNKEIKVHGKWHEYNNCLFSNAHSHLGYYSVKPKLHYHSEEHRKWMCERGLIDED